MATTTETLNPSIHPDEPSPITSTDVVDGAGGVAWKEKSDSEQAENERFWYVAFVMPRSEKKACEALTREAVEAYVPTQWRVHLWRNGRRKKIEQVLIPGIVFVKITHHQIEEVRKAPYVYSYMMDPAKRDNKYGEKTFAIIPEAEMKLLQSMVAQEEYEVAFESTHFTIGEHVRILGFDTFGDTAQVVKLPGKKSTYVGVRVGFLGCAYMEVPSARIVKINEGHKLGQR